MQPILVTVVGGYLGAGKTTLLNHILSESAERIGVIVNDFGSINIDEDLIAHTDDDKITLANGCICCSLVDGFAAALDVLLGEPNPPQRLVIEASGVADPAQIAAYGHAPGLRLDGVITLADAETVRRQADDVYVGDTVRQQLAAADLIVLNKTDLVAPQMLEDTLNWLAGAAPTTAVVGATHASVSLDVLLGSFSGPPVLSESPVAPAEDTFEGWTHEVEAPLDRQDLEAALSALPDEVIRAKGIVRFADDPDTRQVVHRVGQRQTITRDGPWRGGASRLVLIGTRGAISKDWFETKLEK